MNRFIKGNSKLIVALCAFILLIAVVLVCALNYDSFKQMAEASSQVNKTTETESKETTVKASKPQKAESTTEENLYTNSDVFPDEIRSLLEKNKDYLNSLIKNECQQLIVVNTEGKNAVVSYYSFADKAWVKNNALTTSAFIGINGSSSDKKEGDGCTPLGLYKINSAFYINEKPQTKLDAFQITEDSYWVDDVNSAYYNQYVTDVDKKDWNSAEHMIDYNGYKYGFVVDYNPSCVPDMGSAIFFHIGYNPTAGCIATNEEMILKYLSALDKDKNPFVLIV